MVLGYILCLRGMCCFIRPRLGPLREPAVSGIFRKPPHFCATYSCLVRFALASGGGRSWGARAQSMSASTHLSSRAPFSLLWCTDSHRRPCHARPPVRDPSVRPHRAPHHAQASSRSRTSRSSLPTLLACPLSPTETSPSRTPQLIVCVLYRSRERLAELSDFQPVCTCLAVGLRGQCPSRPGG